MNKLYQRNLYKEKLQDFILNFIYNDKKYKKLIFTGGTCLRKIYNLPRLSEDLDFDFLEDFLIDEFTTGLKEYLTKKEAFKNAEFKIAGNKRTVFVKFPRENNEKIFVRCDFSEIKGEFKTEINPYYADKFNFFILSYDLPTLFTNKIEAFLQRKFFKGANQSIPFKGRDLYDIVWFVQLSAKTGFQLKPNWTKLERDMRSIKEEIIKRIIDKVMTIKKEEALMDISPFIESKEELDGFLGSYKTVINNKLNLLM